jgi:glutaredoxin
VIHLRRRVVLYTAQGCHLCRLARDELLALRSELGFELQEIDIGGRDELERRYRALIPVVELDGEQVSRYRVEPQRLRSLLGAQSDGSRA